MYSYEERIRAVKLYIKLGKRTGPCHSTVGLSNKKFPQELASGVRARPRLASGLYTFNVQILRRTAAGCGSTLP